MQVNIYKDKYIRAKNAYKNLENDYNELVEVFNDTKQTIINSLKNLKHDEHSDLYDVGYNSGIEESIAVVADITVPVIMDSPTILLTRLEYELFKYFKDKGYKYIARDRDGSLYIYKEKPSKSEEVWCTEYGHAKRIRYLEELFDFVKWGNAEPMLIKGIVNSSEVVNNDERWEA